MEGLNSTPRHPDSQVTNPRAATIVLSRGPKETGGAHAGVITIGADSVTTRQRNEAVIICKYK